MIEHVYLEWRSVDLGDRDLAELRAIAVSAGEHPRLKKLTLPAGSEGLARALRILHSSGATRNLDPDEWRVPGRYNMTRRRVWELPDFESAPYLHLRGRTPPPGQQALVFSDDGLVRMPAPALEGRRRRLLASGELVLAVAAVADDLRRAGLRGLAVRPALVVTGVATPGHADGPVVSREELVQLASDRVLPPMSPSIGRYVSRYRSPGVYEAARVGGEVDHLHFLRDPPFIDVQPAYLRADFAGVEPFDVAGTFERVEPAAYARMLIVSQRFYRYCRENRIEAEWVPVRFEDAPSWPEG